MDKATLFHHIRHYSDGVIEVQLVLAMIDGEVLIGKPRPHTIKIEPSQVLEDYIVSINKNFADEGYPAIPENVVSLIKKHVAFNKENK